MKMRHANTSVAIIGNQAFSMLNFRGPLIAAICGQGVRVFCLAPDYDEATRAKVKEIGGIPIKFSLSRAGMNPFRDLFDLIKLSILLWQLKPSVTLSYFIKPVIYGTIASWIARVPCRVAMIEGLGYVFSTNNLFSIKKSILKWSVEFVYKITFMLSNKVVLLNVDDIDYLVKKNILPESKVELIDGIGIDLKTWNRLPTVETPMCFLLAARLLKQKGIVEFARAAQIINGKYQGVRFILLGGLDENPDALSKADLDEMVRRNGIEWHGHVPVKPWLEKTSVFVLPTYYREGLPRSILEALASGKPVITTQSPGCKETVIDGFNGYLIPVKDVDSLVCAMEKFILSPELIDKMGSESRLLAERRFDVVYINQRMLRILNL